MRGCDRAFYWRTIYWLQIFCVRLHPQISSKCWKRTRACWFVTASFVSNLQRFETFFASFGSFSIATHSVPIYRMAIGRKKKQQKARAATRGGGMKKGTRCKRFTGSFHNVGDRTNSNKKPLGTSFGPFFVDSRSTVVRTRGNHGGTRNTIKWTTTWEATRQKLLLAEELYILTTKYSAFRRQTHKYHNKFEKGQMRAGSSAHASSVSNFRCLFFDSVCRKDSENTCVAIQYCAKGGR